MSTIKRQPIDAYVPIIGERNTMYHAMITGMTGSGKTVWTGALGERFHSLHPNVAIYLIDPKREYHPTGELSDTVMYPGAMKVENFGPRNGVAVNAKLLTKPKLYERGIYIIHDSDVALSLYDKIYRQQDVNYPLLLWFDEPVDDNEDRTGMAAPGLRRLLREGRSIGVGVWSISQRPKRIDRLRITQATYMYCFQLGGADKDYVAHEYGNDVLLQDPGAYRMWYVNNATREIENIGLEYDHNAA